MALAAQAEGLSVDVWASARPGWDGRETSFALKPIWNNGRLGWPCRLATAKVLRADAEQVRESILYLPEPGPMMTLLYSSFLGLPDPRRLVLTLHGTEILRFARTPHRRWLFAKLLKRADRIGVVSEFNENLLRETFPSVEAEKIRVVPGALRHDFADPPKRKRAVDDGKVRVITVSRIHPRKGQHYVIEALAGMPKELLKKVEYHIVGPIVKSYYADELKAKAQEAGFPVIFVGEVNDADLPQHYADADIFAMTSIQSGISVEGFGLVYLEAAVCGLPVVAHSTGGVPEAVRHGKSGFLAEPGDTKTLQKYFEDLIGSADLRQSMADAGKARAAELSWAYNVRAHFDGLD